MNDLQLDDSLDIESVSSNVNGINESITSDRSERITPLSASGDVKVKTAVKDAEEKLMERHEVSNKSTTESNAPEESAAANDIPKNEIEQTIEMVKQFNNFASPWCSKIQYGHHALLQVGIYKCPSCKQDLLKKGKQDAKNKEKDTQADLKSVQPAPAYFIDFRDLEDKSITIDSWPEPFDLITARKGVVMKDSAIFEVITELNTSIPSEEHRYSYNRDALLQTGILNDSRVRIAVKSSKIVIRSDALIGLITNTVSYYPSMTLGGETVTLKEPYTVLAHYLEDFDAYRAAYLERKDNEAHLASSRIESTAELNATCSKEASEHLDMLFDYVNNFVFKGRIKEERDRHAKGVCTYRMLWLLFKPGTTVYLESQGQLLAYVVYGMDVDSSILSPDITHFKAYHFGLWNLDYDGYFVGRKSSHVMIPYFDGEISISSLQIVPCSIKDNEDGGKTRRRLEEEGEKWCKLLCGKQIYYSGELQECSREYVSINNIES